MEERECTECHNIITEGYIIHDGEEYYCSDECLSKNYRDNEFDELYEQGASYARWNYELYKFLNIL